MSNLTAMGDSAGGILKVEISVDARGRILEQLRLMNITRASLFPGLDGFAQSLRTLLVTESPLQRALRLANWNDTLGGKLTLVATLREFFSRVGEADSKIG